jgi:transcriptional regulator with XRE-family HTH domain
MSDRVKLTAKLSKEVRVSRIQRGLSQYDLAERSGLTRPKIKRIEKHEISSVAKADLRALQEALSANRGKRASGKTSGNGVSRKARKSTSGRTKVTSGHKAPKLNREMRAEVSRRLQESVLEVMRDMIGESGRVLVEKHKLHDVTLGSLFQAA